MNPYLVFCFLLVPAYLIGAIPFGYLVGRARGVDLFRAGSGNIGATNAARVLGRSWGLVVFILDFLKGAVPTAGAGPLFFFLTSEDGSLSLSPELVRVGAASAAFLGHLFPIYLRFRGGKGVATGAGTIFVLVPGPAWLAVLFWLVVFLVSRTVSSASFAAVFILMAARVLGTRDSFGSDALPITLYVLIACTLVIVKHRANALRLWHGQEAPLLPESAGRRTAIRMIHVLALGLWFGGAGFFNFFAAPAIFESFKQVVNHGPSDRTANIHILPVNASAEAKTALASALAGSAVGPVFPLYFGMQAVCALLAFVTCLPWWPVGKIHRGRVAIIALAAVTVSIGWPISVHVSELRLLRFDPTEAVAQAARTAFGLWHRVSLLLSFITVLLAGAALALAARLPEEAVTPKLPKRDLRPNSNGEAGTTEAEKALMMGGDSSLARASG